MRGSDVEYRHQTVVHLIIVSVAFLTYLVQRDDVVWALVRAQSHPRLPSACFLAWPQCLLEFPVRFARGLGWVLSALSSGANHRFFVRGGVMGLIVMSVIHCRSG